MWTYDINTKTYEQVETKGEEQPNWNGSRGSHTATLINNQMYVFGGGKDRKP